MYSFMSFYAIQNCNIYYFRRFDMSFLNISTNVVLGLSTFFRSLESTHFPLFVYQILFNTHLTSIFVPEVEQSKKIHLGQV